MAYDGKAEYRHKDEYRESFPIRHARAISPEIFIAICIVFLVVVFLLWRVFNWIAVDAYRTHPMMVIIGVSTVGLIIVVPPLWKAKVAFDLHKLHVLKEIAEIRALDTSTTILQLNAQRYGFNAEYVRGELAIRSIDPSTGSTHNHYGDEEDDQEDVPQIEAPKITAEHLDLAADYKPHANEFLSAGKLVVGIKGSGKSNTTADICEELGRLNVPMVLADTENEYQSLGDNRYLPNAQLIGREQVQVSSASAFGRRVLEEGMQAIVNLADYEMEEAAWIMVNLISGMREWQEERANELRIPCEFLLEEATTWLPQNAGESPLKGSDVWQPLQSAFFNDLVRKGRKRGLGITIICQKIAEIDKRVLQSDVKLLHRQGELKDLEKYAKMGITNEETLSLKDGEVYVFSPTAYKVRTQMRLRRSPHGAHTPGLSNLRAFQRDGTGERKIDRPFTSLQSGFHSVTELSPDDQDTEEFMDDTEPLGMLENIVNEAVKPSESMPQFSPEEERQIIEIARVQLILDGQVTRSKIPAAMNPPRNNKIYPIIKYICDREGF